LCSGATTPRGRIRDGSSGQSVRAFGALGIWQSGHDVDGGTVGQEVGGSRGDRMFAQGPGEKHLPSARKMSVKSIRPKCDRGLVAALPGTARCHLSDNNGHCNQGGGRSCRASARRPGLCSPSSRHRPMLRFDAKPTTQSHRVSFAMELLGGPTAMVPVLRCCAASCRE
jgi:hypothetical protein